MQEIWKDIPNFNGYQASDKGFIFSKKRNKILIPHPNEKGYLRVCLHVKGKSTTQKVHRLVALTFLENPNNLPEVNHKDGNKLNNRVDNLEWCTHTHNMREAFKNNLIPPRKSNNGSFPTKKVLQFDLDGKLINTYESLSEASKISGIGFRNLSRYCKNQRTCKNYIWRYADE